LDEDDYDDITVPYIQQLDFSFGYKQGVDNFTNSGMEWSLVNRGLSEL